MTIVLLTLRIIIDLVVGAPGHSKDIVGGISARNKGI